MTQTNEGSRWRGINHLAMITPDMDETVRFYHGVLGMRLVATLSAGPMRHYFFELGPQNTIAFFEWSRAETFAKATPEHKVAMMDALKWVHPRGVDVHQARDLLGRLDKLYAEDAAEIISDQEASEEARPILRDVRVLEHAGDELPERLRLERNELTGRPVHSSFPLS